MERIVLETDPLNCETPLRALAGSEVPVGSLYVRNHFAVPEVDPERWRLVVRGLVDDELELSLADLAALPQREVACVLECAGNGRTLASPTPPGTPWRLGAAGGVRARGVALADVLGAAGVRDEATQVVATGADGGEVAPGRTERFARALPLAKARDPDTLVAVELNGAPLAPEHGAPARLTVPGWYAVSSVKWLVDLEVRREPFRGHYHTHAYTYRGDPVAPEGTPTADIRVRAVVTEPADGDRLPPGPVRVAGTAWSGSAPVAAVEVAVDGATWERAVLDPAPGPYAPVRWSFAWTPDREGAHELAVRAIDAAGASQPLRSVWNELGYGNNAVHRVRVTVA